MITPWLRTLAGLLAFMAATPLRAEEPAIPKACRSRKGLGLFVSPEVLVASRPLRVVVVSERPQPGARLVAQGPQGALALKAEPGGGPPFHWVATIAAPQPGPHRFALVNRDGEALACGRRRVEPRPPRALPLPHEQWSVKRSWSRYTENLYAVWIEKLFDAPAGQQPSWTPLHQVIRDPTRNILYNHLGTDEDGPDAQRAVVVQPDCADLPYFLRAYFSFKLGLPFGYRHCDRGSSTRPTKCENQLRSNLSTQADSTGPLATRFSRYLRHYVSYVHSGSGRTGPDDDETDLYPVALSRAVLRPGIVYVDPYGHLLVVAKWVEPTATRGGILYAVDGHPDLSVGRKRFWRGAFLFSDKIQGGAGGFKAFRPLVVKGGSVVALGNQEIQQNPDYRNHSAEQYRLGLDGFYDRMERIINPRPLPALQLYGERLDALYELIQERVGSVQAGEDYVRKNGRTEITMPDGPKIFETKGAWEDYSTPARDMRLLIAIEEVMRYPQRVEERPDRFALRKGQSPTQTRRDLEGLYERFTKSKTFSYKRSDGSEWKLTVAQLVSRRKRLEVAYNPNDCAEIRWAAEGSELDTCNRHAPEAQRRRMERYRVWFATRTRPPLR